MAKNNNALITEGFELIRPMLAAFVARELRRVAGKRWWEELVHAKLYDDQKRGIPGKFETDDVKCEDALDIALTLNLIAVNWGDVFKFKMSREQRAWALELSDVRNRWAHSAGEGFSDDKTWRALDTMARLMENIDKEAAAAVRKLLRKAQYGGNGISTENIPDQTPQPVPAAVGVLSAAGGSVKPWRLVAIPHDDVAKGEYRQAEFALDLSEVVRGTASREYQDPVDFFARTYLTEGIRSLLITALRRVCGLGGEPVVQLKTAFGGGKTHSLLALYHLLRNGKIADKLPGVTDLLRQNNISSIPEVRVAVLVGTALDATKSRKPVKMPGITINTLWGEMTAQLAEQAGQPDLYDLVKEADKKGVAPGSDTLVEIFNRIGPCLVLIDEFIAYARNIYGISGLPSGDYSSLMTFMQALTEAARRSKNSLVVASLPASDMEMGGEAGRIALEQVEHIFGRIDTIWKSAGQDEGFEIVRRRLFKDITDRDAVEKTARAFTKQYMDNPGDYPPECREVSYLNRMISCYPIHPEVFDRLYGDWAAIDQFQRTRGVLRLMAKVVFDLWQSGNADALIMPGSINFGNSHVREELARYLPGGWTSVIDREVDGPRSVPAQLDNKNPRFGQARAAKRVARAILLGSAPAAEGQRLRGLEESRVLLGVVQPEEQPSLFKDAINSMQDQSANLYAANRRYWYDTRPTLRKTVQDRAGQKTREEAEYAIEKIIVEKFREKHDFAGVHRCPASSAEVPDEPSARLVILRTAAIFAGADPACRARVEARNILETKGNSPRINRNMLAFIAADRELIVHAVNEMKILLAWQSIADDKDVLNLDNAQLRDVRNSIETSTTTVENRIMEAYCRLMVPSQEGTNPIQWEEFYLPGIEHIVRKASRKMKSDELLILQWSPYLLKMKLDEQLWQGKTHIEIKTLWGYLCQYCYLPRLRNEEVFANTLRQGIMSDEYFGYAEGVDNDGKYVALSLGKLPPSINMQTGLLVHVDAAKKQLAAIQPSIPRSTDEPAILPRESGDSPCGMPIGAPPAVRPQSKPKRFFASGKLDPGKAGSSAGKIDEEILYHLTKLAGAQVDVRIDIQVKVPGGIPDDVLRTVLENSKVLKMNAGVDEE